MPTASWSRRSISRLAIGCLTGESASKAYATTFVSQNSPLVELVPGPGYLVVQPHADRLGHHPAPPLARLAAPVLVADLLLDQLGDVARQGHALVDGQVPGLLDEIIGQGNRDVHGFTIPRIS